MKDSEFLMWLRDRLKFMYDESPLTDFVIRVKNKAHEALVKEASALAAEPAQPVAQFHAHPADWQYNITLLPGVPMLLDGTKLYLAPQPPAYVPRLSDEDFEKLIDNSDARWAEDVYVIDSGSVIDLLRAVEAEVLRRMGVALQGLIADGCLTRTLQGHARPFNESEVADQAYTMADTMLAERQRGAA